MAADPLRPQSAEQAAESLRELARGGDAVRPLGARTKLDWGPGTSPGPDPREAATTDGERGAHAQEVELETGGLARILAHDRGDFTAVLEAGVPLREAQAAFAAAGQRLALDPPLGDGEAATVGGVLSTADSGPSRHRYGGPRDLVIGIAVALSDGTIARSGGKVIKNVAGYDLGKLFVGSHGTLGLIVEACVRLHPLPGETATLRARSSEADALTTAASALARLPLEAEALDLAWEGHEGSVLARFAGRAAAPRAAEAARRLARLHVEVGRRPADLQIEVERDDEPLWERQRDMQRRPDGAVLKVSALPSELPIVLATARSAGASVVSRAALGLSWLSFAPDDSLPARVASVRAQLAPRACLLLDGGARLHDEAAFGGVVLALDGQVPRGGADVAADATLRGTLDAGAIALMERVRERFDPAALFRPGVPLGSI
ncbi:MAG: FAD-binding oxidoreductase [Solirubrobacteraceae bacterium]